MDTPSAHRDPPKGRRVFSLRKIFLSKRPPPPSFLAMPNKGLSAPDTSCRIASGASNNSRVVMHELDHPTVIYPNLSPAVAGPGMSSLQPNIPNGSTSAIAKPDRAGPDAGDGTDVILERLNNLSPKSPSTGFFPGAHSFRMDKPTFIEQTNVYKNEKPLNDREFLEKFVRGIDNGGTVLLILDKKRVAGAEMDSLDRYPPPQCHPETRLELWKTLAAWLLNDQRHSNFIWLSGPAGAGKTAVAQTFAEHCQELGQLGASYFFSRSRRDTANGFIATIAYQLADHNAGYNNLITRILSKSPAILDKVLRVQFQKLIVEPFAVLAAQCSESNTSCKPLVIIVDGIDECSDEDAQRQIIKLIGKYATGQSFPSHFSVLWLLCSRPEWHIKRTFASADPYFKCSHETITCDAAQDAKDVYKILKDGLQRIRDKASWTLSGGVVHTQWPPESKLQRLAQKVGGLPVLASTILRFIGDGTGSPDRQLDISLAFLEATGDLIKVNPLGTLDSLYRQIMSRIPQSILPTTQKILSFYILSSSFRFDFPREAPGVACFLFIDKDTFYTALRNLHSVIRVPPLELAHQEPLSFFHKSFVDFLENPARSGSFAPDLDQARGDMAISALRWTSYALRRNCKLRDKCTCNSFSLTFNVPDWVSVDGRGKQRGPNYRRVRSSSRRNLWNICNSLCDSERPRVLAELAKFDFCHLYMRNSDSIDFRDLVEWLQGAQELKDNCEQGLVRLKPSSELDKSLVPIFGESLSLLGPFGRGQVRRKLMYHFFSHHQNYRAIYPPLLVLAEEKIWLGEGEQTVLAYGISRERVREARSRKEIVTRTLQLIRLKSVLKELNPVFQYEMLREMYAQLFVAEYNPPPVSLPSLADWIAAQLQELTKFNWNGKMSSEFLLTASSCEDSLRSLFRSDVLSESHTQEVVPDSLIYSVNDGDDHNHGDNDVTDNDNDDDDDNDNDNDNSSSVHYHHRQQHNSEKKSSYYDDEADLESMPSLRTIAASDSDDFSLSDLDNDSSLPIDSSRMSASRFTADFMVRHSAPTFRQDLLSFLAPRTDRVIPSSSSSEGDQSDGNDGDLSDFLESSSDDSDTFFSLSESDRGDD